MNTKNLEAFLVVARLLNFGEAARTLNYSQSTVSEQIQSLEDELGARLFERIGRRVFLTEQGRQVIPFAERMVRDMTELKNMFRSPESVAGTLAIGSAESLCAFWLPPLLKEYRRRYPQVQTSIRVGNCVDFPQWLQQNQVDVAFTMNDERGRTQLEQRELFQGKTMLVAAPDHELAAKKRIMPADLSGQTVLLPEGYCGYPMDLRQLLSQERVAANMIMEFGSIESIKQCVRNGLGVSLLPGITVAEELLRGDMLALDWCGPEIPIQANMIIHRHKWVSPALAALAELVMDSVQGRCSSQSCKLIP